MGFFPERDHDSPFFKCRLGLPVVRDRSCVISMKSIDMYILHDSSLVVSLIEYIGVFCVKLSDPACLRNGLRVKVVDLRESVSPRSLGIGLDRVLVFRLSGVMISIKSINLHIGHESSVGVCFAKTLRIYRISKTPW